MRRILVLDFESTGKVDHYPDEPWQLGYAEVLDGKLDMSTAGEFFMFVGDRPVNPHAPGRYEEMRSVLSKAPTLRERYIEILQLTEGRLLCAHNTSTERNHLKKAFPLHTFGPWIDTLAVSRAAFPDCGKYSLENVTEYLGLGAMLRSICPGRDYHDALFDAAASGLILQEVLQTWPDLDTQSLLRPDMTNYYSRRRST